MDIRIVEIHPAADAKQLNTEWFVLANEGDKPFSTRGCALHVQKKPSPKKTSLGTMDPGFHLGPGEKVRVITGNPGRKAHGAVPGDELKNYSLFLNAPVLRGDGTVLVIALRSALITSAVYDSSQTNGIAEPSE